MSESDHTHEPPWTLLPVEWLGSPHSHRDAPQHLQAILVSVSLMECELWLQQIESSKISTTLGDILSEEERSHLGEGPQRAHHLAARYAAKRGAATLTGLEWREFYVTRAEGGAPKLKGLSQRAQSLLDHHPIALSLTHDDPVAIAYLAR